MEARIKRYQAAWLGGLITAGLLSLPAWATPPGNLSAEPIAGEAQAVVYSPLAITCPEALDFGFIATTGGPFEAAFVTLTADNFGNNTSVYGLVNATASQFHAGRCDISQGDGGAYFEVETRDVSCNQGVIFQPASLVPEAGYVGTTTSVYIVGTLNIPANTFGVVSCSYTVVASYPGL